jgi:CHASE2 domain-containing sensor protein/tRNA A-37 threonylcarbamoyl transferase component Bud32
MFSHAAMNPSRIGLAGPVALLLLLVLLVWAAGDRMLRLEFSIYDFLQQQWSAEPSDRVLLVDTGTADTGAGLWTDTRLPDVIDRLRAAGAAVIVPIEPPPPGSDLPDMRQLTALLELEQRANQTGRDVQTLSDQLAGIRKQFQVRGAIESAFANAGNTVVAMTPADPRQAQGLDPCQRLAVPMPADGLLQTLQPARELLALPPSLCAGAARAGYAGFRPDPDGTVRQSALLVRSDDLAVPTLALAALIQAVGQTPGLDVADDGTLRLGKHALQTGADYSVLLRYYGDRNAANDFATVTPAEILDAAVDAEQIRGRAVLLGPVAGNARYRSPVDSGVSSMVMTATSLSNLLQHDYLVRPGWLPWSELLLLLALAAMFLLLAPNMSLNAAALAALFIGTILLTTEAYLLLAHGVWVRLGLPMVFSALGITSVVGLRYLRNAEPLPAATPQAVGPELGIGDELDLAFSVLRQQPPTDDTKERLYRIAVNHGRRREFAKAERVLRYLASIDPSYRGVQDKLEKLSGAAADQRVDGGIEIPPEPGKRVPHPADKGGRQHLGRYEVIKVLGRGAMATVYLGEDPKINRKVAIKTIALAEEFSAEDLQAAKEQFLREAESAGRLNHPNIIAIYDVDEDDDVAYLAMEYFEGKSLSHFAASGNLLPPDWVLELGARAAEALHYAHSQNVVHRDIKPANIMYNANSDALKLTDFGIARLTDTSRTKTGIILGTPSYMSPEQLAGSPVTGQSDLYSLGITLYHLLTGAPPFRADSIPKLMDKIVNEQHAQLSAVRDDLPPCIDELFDRALAKDPADRYANGRSMALALRDCCSKFKN